MSFPSFPNITPSISLTIGQTPALLLGSIALEELALAHLINAEAEKVQFVLGTLTPTQNVLPTPVTISNLLDINRSVRSTLRDIIKKEMLLEFKFENILELLQLSPSPLFPPPTPPPPTPFCSCEVNFEIPRSEDTVVLRNGTEEGTGRLSSIGGGRAFICNGCDPADTDLLDFEWGPGDNPSDPATVTFTATSYNLTSEGSLGSCVDETVFTITGTGVRNGVPGISFSLTLTNNPDSFFLVLGGNETFTATNLPAGQIMIIDCNNG
ncbi:hypothetical protein [Hazenella coriacea]|uniref:Uncharacterized protein n=1 Tax=Hazenella coriacea TaxID=1179467 RepID=A0A4R3L327_9BACL|nr:hypothetical protein EDD58_10665 [Hazenella coriacea]